jgi:hypothetical protein
LKILHIATIDVYKKHQLNFQGHALEVANGLVLMITEMSQHAQLAFEAEADVLPLPFILSQKPIGHDIAQHLTAHSVTGQHTTFEAAELVAKSANHGAFHFSQF